MNLEAKLVADTAFIMPQVVMPAHANVAGTMHGGEVVKLMDTTAGVVAARHSQKNCATISISQVLFIAPILVGELLICEAQIAYTGNTSMVIFASVYVERIGSSNVTKAAEGYFSVVALDADGHPAPVPPLKLVSEEEKICYEAAKIKTGR